MNQKIIGFLKIIILFLFLAGIFLILKNKFDRPASIVVPAVSSKSLTLKKYLLKYQKPQRVEVTGLSERFSQDIIELKKLKIAQDPNSNFYVTIQFFSDESDDKAPLIAQIRFIEMKSGNAIKEESINLE